MSPAPGPIANDLWAITAYFNPRHYQRRPANYRVFRKHLSLPLLTVEVSFDGHFELAPDAADLLVQLRGRDVMWQKERLLNIALAALPRSCRKVVWTDCDILFERGDWGAVSRALDGVPLVQPFQWIYDCPAEAVGSELRDPARALYTRPSLPFAISTGRSPVDCLTRITPPVSEIVATGFVWAARREVLEKHGFYDGMIVGGADRVMACAVFGCFDEVMNMLDLNECERAHYLAWAKPFYQTIRGQVAFVADSLFHLWHGAIKHRGYTDRHRDLRRFHFDPYTDIRVDDHGLWCWNSDKPDLHQYLDGYFATRKEDG